MTFEKGVPVSLNGKSGTVAEIIREQMRRGGEVCVVSHSFKDNILRDYAAKTGTAMYICLHELDLDSDRLRSLYRGLARDL